jgi:pyruvate dehydrogenase E1 component alpha subunit
MRTSDLTSIERRSRLREDPLERYRRMVEIRVLEDAVLDLFSRGEIAGSTHTCQGQEAVAVGLAVAAEATDTVTCTYRGHGFALALGATPVTVLGEILNRESGCIGGMGGSMHLSAPEVGLFPTFAIVGAGLPVAVGAAMHAQIEGTGEAAVAVFGDGTANIGAFHESLNLAAVWKLGVVFLCENNLYAEYTGIARSTPATDLVRRADAYDMPGEVVDGQDVAAVERAVESALSRARVGDGPTLLEVKTYRYAGHSRGDAALYRPEGELEMWRRRDPIELMGAELVERGEADEAELDQLRQAATADVAAAVEQVLSAPRPGVPDMFRNVFEEAPR